MDFLERCQQLIAVRMGFQLRPADKAHLQKTLAARMQALKFARADDYLELLAGSDATAEAEWKRLYVLLTNQESYFFRDAGQFDLLRSRILPEIIERNRGARTLRVWSAGCSTGEEPYSLAILVDQLLPMQSDWKVMILGTDLSEAAVTKAQRGVYGAWSFRTLDPELRDRYFEKRQKDFVLNGRIRNNVMIRHGNLIGDDFPSRQSEIHDLDLILCRNVFIYFKREAVAQVLRKFERSLCPGGYLITGHAELHDAPLGELRALSLPQSVVYQRAAAPREMPAPYSAPSSPTTAISLPRDAGAAKIAITSQRKSVDEKRPATEAGLVSKTAAATNVAPAQGERDFLALCAQAQQHADLGQHEEAARCCREASSLQPFAPLPHWILARVCGERGETEEAKSLLKKVIYLAPRLPLPYLEMSLIYDNEGDAARARKMRATALEALSELNEDISVPALEHEVVAEKITVGALREYLRALGQ